MSKDEVRCVSLQAEPVLEDAFGATLESCDGSNVSPSAKCDAGRKCRGKTARYMVNSVLMPVQPSTRYSELDNADH